MNSIREKFMSTKGELFLKLYVIEVIHIFFQIKILRRQEAYLNPLRPNVHFKVQLLKNSQETSMNFSKYLYGGDSHSENSYNIIFYVFILFNIKLFNK